MDFKDFDELCGFVESHTIEDMLCSVYQYLLIDYNFNGEIVNDANYLRNILEQNYKCPYCKRIRTEITDIKENIVQYKNLYDNIFMDEISKKVLFNLLAYRLTIQKSRLYLAYCGGSRQYFDSRIAFYKNDCIFVDCGGLDGKNSVEFAIECPTYKHIYIYEPIKEYYLDCLNNIKKLGIDRVTIRNSAVYDKKTDLFFDIGVKGSSRVAERGAIKVSAISLDEDIQEPIGFLKMDIEGAEKQAIEGSKKHIKEDTPYLAICVYHRPEDIWEITNQIISINDKYDFYLRHHRIDPNETVLYAVPREKNSKNIKDSIKACNEFVAGLSIYEANIMTNELLFLFQQLENHKIALRNSEKVVRELQSWSEKLYEAKEWLSQQYEKYKDEKECK